MTSEPSNSSEDPLIHHALTRTATSEEDSTEFETVGASVGPYKLVRQLGKGGMGVVFLADQEQPIRRQVALKIIKLGMDTKRLLKRFEIERQTLAEMQHPNIAAVLDAGTTQTGRPFFVMELVQGSPITHFADEHRLSVRARLELFTQVCRAVQHAHQKGVIHRDIKPSNVLVTLVDNEMTPKVIDFGLAKAMGQPLSDQSQFTPVGAVVGTLLYMSPEQAKLTDSEVDTRSDVYALGVLLYELLTGAPTLDLVRFKSASFTERLTMIQEFQPKTPSQRVNGRADAAEISASRSVHPQKLARQLRGELDWVVMKALEKEPHRRYATTAQFEEQIRRFLRGDTVEVGPPSRIYRFRKFVAKNRLAIATSVTFATVLIAATIFSAWQAVKARQAENLAIGNEQQAREAFDDADAARKQAEQLVENLKRILRSPDPDLASPVREVVDMLDLAYEEMLPTIEDDQIKARLLDAIGEAYAGLGYPRQASKCHQRAFELRKGVLGDHHIDTVQSKARWGSVVVQAGDYKTGLKLVREAASFIEPLLPADHPVTLSIRHNYAEALRRNGEKKAAAELFQEVLVSRRRVLGPAHPDTINTMTSLAAAYEQSGESKAALNMLQSALEILKKQDAAHPRVLILQGNIGTLHLRQGRVAQAADVLQQAREKAVQRYGETHPKTAWLLNKLGRVSYEQDDLSKAEALYQQALTILQDRLGNAHDYTLENASNLAMVYQEQGRFEEAILLLRPTHKTLLDNYGDQFEMTMGVGFNLGGALLKNRQFGEAVELLERTYAAISKKRISEQSLGKLCSNYLERAEELKRIDDAVKLHSNNLDALTAEPAGKQDEGVRKEAVNTLASSVLKRARHLAAVNLKAAFEDGLEALKLYRKVDNRDQIANTQYVLAKIQKLLGKREQGKQRLNESLRIYQDLKNENGVKSVQKLLQSY